MSSHPNRSRRHPSPAANPRPTEIRAAREAAGLSQTAAGAVIGRSLRVWQAYEAGERRIDPILWLVWRIRTATLPPAAIL